MTDKQIIIDGEECRYWFRLNPGDYRKCSLRGKNDNCEEIKDCFVKELLKQLKRKDQEFQEAMDNYVQLDLQRVKEYNELVNLYKAKEQECEKLKTDNATLFDKAMETRKENTNIQVQLDQLKAENEKLKKQIEIFTRQLEKTNKEVIKEKEKNATQRQENEKLEQTLTEIKEIAEIEIECKTYEIENDCFNETRCKALNEHIDFIKQILQKISECEVENER